MGSVTCGVCLKEILDDFDTAYAATGEKNISFISNSHVVNF